PEKVAIAFGLDPLGSVMTAGHLAAPWDEVGQRLSETVKALRDKGYGGALMTCDTRPVHEAGGSEAQELAAALAMGVSYLRALAAGGLAPDQARSHLSWTLAVDADQFTGIAKLRAMRALWARVEDAAGLTPRPIHIHAETAWRMMTRRDAAVNMLRTTMATFVAGVGGADSLSVLPYTLPLGLPDAFARRVARNTQTVLLEESNLWRVTDPVAGAGAYEELMDGLCDKAWSLFQEIEAAGGFAKALAAGQFQAQIAVTRAQRAKAVATRRIAITGTSEFPALADAPQKTLDVKSPAVKIPVTLRGGSQNPPFPELTAQLAGGGSMASISPPPKAALSVDVFPSERLAEPFEALRDAADAHAAKTGSRASVFLANLGTVAEHAARAGWIRNLLAAGGIDVLGNEGFTQSGDAGRAFAESGATIACICGSDTAYGELGEATAQALKTAGATHVLLAGRPGEAEAELKAAGVDGFLYAGIDVVAALKGVQEVLGV
ncbi:MAG TPA: methylmalonyl-CoA mutase family protein, partial [Hyphomicrobiaceae bacterium]|nr:methylmalonyl-CoA mutase family protein [Hyphomicrobiaceae bacterium]